MRKFFLYVVFILSAVPSWAQDVSAVNPNGMKVKKITAVTIYAEGYDMNFEKVVEFDTAGTPVTITQRGFGGQNTRNLTIGDTNVDHRFDATHHVDSVFVRTFGQRRLDHIDKYDYDGDLVTRHRFLYRDGRCVLHSTSHYIYSATHRCAKINEYGYDLDDGHVAEIRYTFYDKKGNEVLVQIVAPDEVLLYSESKYYDRHGNCVKDVRVSYDDRGEDGDKSVYKSKYTYDKNGNWVRCVYYMADRPLYTVTREIVYW